MTWRLVVRPAAEADLDDARRWYERQRPGLGNRFVLAVEQTMQRLLRNPEFYGRVHGEIRRTHVHRFPYGVFYRILGDQVVILGVLHGRRDPRVWQTRN